MRRQECVRKQGHGKPSGHVCDPVSCSDEYVIEKLITLQASDLPTRPWFRKQVQAAVTIQRAYRAHRAVMAFEELDSRIKFAASQPVRMALTFLRARAADLGSLGALLDVDPHLNGDPRILRKAENVTKALSSAIDRATTIERAQRVQVMAADKRCSDLIGGADVFTDSDEDDSSDSDFEDVIHEAWKSKKKELQGTQGARSPDEMDDESIWEDVSSPGSDYLDSSEDYFEYGTGIPEGGEVDFSEARLAAIASLCSGSRQRREWISKILAAPPLKNPSRRRTSVSKVPKLLTISEEIEVEA